MKKQTLIVASLCLVAGLAISANAQTEVKAKVPFSFVVSGKILPAGDYTMVANPHQVKIEDADGNILAMVLANEVSGHLGQKGRIIFHCYRDRCFLAEVWPASRENGRELLTSRAEAELAKEVNGKYFAVLAEKPTP